MIVLTGFFRKCAGAGEAFQSAGIAPRENAALPHEIERADDLYALVVLGADAREHGLHLPAVEHGHQRGLNHIVVVMPQRDFVASKLLCLAVQTAAPQTGAEKTGVVGLPIDGFKQFGIVLMGVQSECLNIGIDLRACRGKVSGIHGESGEPEGDFAVFLKHLKQDAEQERVLSAGNADGDMVTWLDQPVVTDCGAERIPDCFAELCGDQSLGGIRLIHTRLSFLLSVITVSESKQRVK